MSPTLISVLNSVPLAGPALLRLLDIDSEQVLDAQGWETFSEAGSEVGEMLLPQRQPTASDAADPSQHDVPSGHTESCASYSFLFLMPIQIKFALSEWPVPEK